MYVLCLSTRIWKMRIVSFGYKLYMYKVVQLGVRISLASVIDEACEIKMTYRLFNGAVMVAEITWLRRWENNE